jgi:hypothetical protein
VAVAWNSLATAWHEYGEVRHVKAQAKAQAQAFRQAPVAHFLASPQPPPAPSTQLQRRLSINIIPHPSFGLSAHPPNYSHLLTVIPRLDIHHTRQSALGGLTPRTCASTVLPTATLFHGSNTPGISSPSDLRLRAILDMLRHPSAET